MLVGLWCTICQLAWTSCHPSERFPSSITESSQNHSHVSIKTAFCWENIMHSRHIYIHIYTYIHMCIWHAYLNLASPLGAIMAWAVVQAAGGLVIRMHINNMSTKHNQGFIVNVTNDEAGSAMQTTATLNSLPVVVMPWKTTGDALELGCLHCPRSARTCQLQLQLHRNRYHQLQALASHNHGQAHADHCWPWQAAAAAGWPSARNTRT